MTESFGSRYGQADQHWDTHFASPTRSTREQIEHAVAAMQSSGFLGGMLDAADVFLMIVDRNRQIVAANSVLLDVLRKTRTADPVGLRPGEALGCVHAWQEPAGCGTSDYCSTCGAALSIILSQQVGVVAERDCLMTVRNDGELESCEYAVRATPLTHDGVPYTVVSFRDVSGEKRRAALEQIFFHDVLNTLSGIFGWTALLQDEATPDTSEAIAKVSALTSRLHREINDQRTLLEAERGTLRVQREPLDAADLLHGVTDVFRHHEVARERQLVVEEPEPGDQCVTDRTLVERILVNMVKNALEATPKGGTVRLWTERNPRGRRFHVWNRQAIPPDVQLQIFRRSFSTKSAHGRGLGTYSMRLLAERYLDGRVSFSSDEDQGTVFTLSIDVVPGQDTAPLI